MNEKPVITDVQVHSQCCVCYTALLSKFVKGLMIGKIFLSNQFTIHKERSTKQDFVCHSPSC